MRRTKHNRHNRRSTRRSRHARSSRHSRRSHRSRRQNGRSRRFTRKANGGMFRAASQQIKHFGKELGKELAKDAADKALKKMRKGDKENVLPSIMLSPGSTTRARSRMGDILMDDPARKQLFNSVISPSIRMR